MRKIILALLLILSLGMSSSVYGDMIQEESNVDRSIAGKEAKSKIIRKGLCSNKVKFKLYENGLLTIYGSGKMDDNDDDTSPFYDEIRLKKLVIKNKVTYIGKYEFHDCVNLKTIKFGKSVKRIGEHAFLNCFGLKSVSIPASVKIIDDFAFMCCYDIKSVKIGKSVTKIGKAAFYGNEKLKKVDIKSTKIKKIGKDAFGSSEDIVIQVPKKKYKAYKKMLEKAGFKGEIEKK